MEGHLARPGCSQEERRSDAWGRQDEKVLRSEKWSQRDDETLPATHPMSRNPVTQAKKMPYLSAELSQVSVTCSQKNSDDLSPWIAMR